VAVIAELADAVVTTRSFPLLSGVCLTLDGPSLTVVTGANGAGKTSLLRLLGGLESVSSGKGTVLGVDLARGDRRALRRRSGWLGHDGAFYDDLTVGQNLAFAARALGRPVSAIPAALERVGLLGRADTPAKALSAGQRRRMGLASILVRRPELWLLDEPYASIDESGRALVGELIAEAVAAGASVVVSSHDPISSPTPAVTVVMSGGRVRPRSAS
jgi:heme ABC exporter ATP-binding subunit CcmA